MATSPQKVTIVPQPEQSMMRLKVRLLTHKQELM